MGAISGFPEKINGFPNTCHSPIGTGINLRKQKIEGVLLMPETNLPTPLVLPLRASYPPILARVVAAQGAWVLIDPADLGGIDKQAKQCGLLQAARSRGLRFSTSFRLPGWCCARLVIDNPASSSTGSLTTRHQVVFTAPASSMTAGAL
jgi:hypothetical protein